MCAIGRALMSRPKMILLDEPSMGLAPQLVEEIFEIVVSLNAKEGCRSCSPSRTPSWRSDARATATCWRTAAWCSTARPALGENEDARSSTSGSPKAGASFREGKHYRRRAGRPDQNVGRAKARAGHSALPSKRCSAVPTATAVGIGTLAAMNGALDRRCRLSGNLRCAGDVDVRSRSEFGLVSRAPGSGRVVGASLVLLAAIALFGRVRLQRAIASLSAGLIAIAQYFIGSRDAGHERVLERRVRVVRRGLAVISGVMWLRPGEARSTGERRALRQARTRDPQDRERDVFGRLPDLIARAQRARLGQAARRRRSQRRDLACRARQAAGAAQVRPAGGAGGAAVRRLQRDGARQGAAPADVAGADLRAGRRGQDWWGAARACSRPASAPATSCTTPSRTTPRPAASSWSRRARARLRGDSAGIGTEQQIEAIAHFARRLYRHAGFPQDPARCRRQAGKDVSRARGQLRRRCRPRFARAGRARRQGAAVLRHRRARRHRLRERRA